MSEESKFPSTGKINEDVILYLVHEKAHIQKLLAEVKAEHLRILKEQPVEFHDDVNLEFNGFIKTVIAIEVARNVHGDPFEILAVLEDLQLKDYVYEQV